MGNIKKTVLIIEPGFKSYKEPILKSIYKLRRNIRIVIACGLNETVPSTWAKNYCDHWITFDYRKNDLIKKINEFQKRYKTKIDGALTYVDPAVCLTNEIQHALKLPQISKKIGRHLKNKSIMRVLLNKYKVTQPSFFIIKNKTDLNEIIKKKLKFPIVIKPSEMMSGLGVLKINNKIDLSFWFDKIHKADFWDEKLRDYFPNMGCEVLVEECIDGRMLSVEALTQNGKVSIIGITSKFTQNRNSNYFDEIGHTFPADKKTINNDLRLKIESLIKKSHSALNIQNSITHTEIKIRNNTPYIIEINTRIAGGLISLLIEKSTFINIGKLLVDISLGQTINQVPVSRSNQSIGFIGTEKEGLFFKKNKKNKINYLLKDRSLIWRDALQGKTRIAYMLGKKINIKLIKDFEKLIYVDPIIEVNKDKENNPNFFIIKSSINLIDEIFNLEKKTWSKKHCASKKELNQNHGNFTQITLCARKK